MTKRRKLISAAEATQSCRQHTKPCSDCPWSRSSLPGWLGGASSKTWLKAAHGEDIVKCHVVDNQQCAGLAIYRANVAKKPRDPSALKLPKDKVRVFAMPHEFTDHHGIDE